jgi:hypothetical protein
MKGKGLSIAAQLSNQVKVQHYRIRLLGLLKLFLQEDNHFFYVSARRHAQNDSDRVSAQF